MNHFSANGSLHLGRVLLGCLFALFANSGTWSLTKNVQAGDKVHLDVGILIFDTNIPDTWRKIEGQQVVPDVRKTESVIMPYIIRETLARSEQWGVVRVLPRPSETFEVTVKGKILFSTGERLRLQIEVEDVSGRRWFRKVYRHKSNRYAYEPAQVARGDPFSSVYQKIADDMLAHYQNKLKPQQLNELRRIARIRFAQSFSPEAFEGYLKTAGANRIRLTALPSEESPAYQRIERIREREHLFVDSLNSRYADFYEEVYKSYVDWRKFSYEELIERRKLRRESVLKGLLGVATIAGGIVAADAPRASTRVLGDLGVIAGGMLVQESLNAGQEAEIHAAALEELNISFSDAASDSVLEMEDTTITLTGTVEEQYLQLRDILKEIWLQEAGAE